MTHFLLGMAVGVSLSFFCDLLYYLFNPFK